MRIITVCDEVAKLIDIVIDEEGYQDFKEGMPVECTDEQAIEIMYRSYVAINNIRDIVR